MSFYSKIAPYYDKLFAFNKAAYSFIKEYNPTGKPSILDIGCGTGMMAGELGNIANHVTGIDIDADMLKVGRANYPDVEFIFLDMLAVRKLSQEFDLIFSIGNVMSYLPANHLNSFLTDIYYSLAPGGIWIFQTVNWDKIVKLNSFDFPVLESEEENVEFIRKYNNISVEKVEFLTRCTKSGKEIFSDTSHLFPCISKGYMKKHEQTGFTLTGHYGDYKKNHFIPESSPANIFVYRK